MNPVLARKKRQAVSPLERERRELQRRDAMSRAGLEMTRETVTVWKAVCDQIENFSESQVQELEALIEQTVIYEWGPDTKVEFERGFQSVTVSNPDGRINNL